MRNIIKKVSNRYLCSSLEEEYIQFAVAISERDTKKIFEFIRFFIHDAKDHWKILLSYFEELPDTAKKMVMDYMRITGQLNDSDLSGIFIHNLYLSGLSISNVNLDMSQSTNLYIDNSELKKCNLRYYTVENIHAENSILNKCEMFGLKSKYSNLKNSTLNKCKMIGTRFSQTNFSGSLISDCVIKASTFFSGYFEDTILDRCVANQTQFKKINMRGTVFNNVNLNYAFFEKCNLQNADLSSCYNIEGTYFIDSFANKNTKWPTNFNPADHGVTIE